MKRRISDLLDGIREDSVELNTVTPLSSSRIKELTMGKIEKKEKKHRTGGRRIAFNILVAAVAISLLTVTVSAAEYIFGAGDWFKGSMEQQLEDDKVLAQAEGMDVTVAETISQGQVEVANALGQNFKEQTITVDGTTMTMTAAYGDARVLHAYLQVEAPEGTVLPDDMIYKFFDYSKETWDFITVADGAPYEGVNGYLIEANPVKDENPNDNKKDFDIFIISEMGQEAGFNDGVAKYLNIGGLYEQVVDANGDEDAYRPIVEGDFIFDIGLINEAKVCSLDVSQAAYGGHYVRTWTHPGMPHSELCDPYDENGVHTEEFDYTVTPEYLEISPLTAQWRASFTCSNDRVIPSLQFQIVMKDGTTALGRDGGGSGDDETFAEGLFIFSVPIDLDQVDYILVGDPKVGEPVKLKLPM